MSSSDIEILTDMGFSATKAEKALAITGNNGVVPAMEWLLAHTDDQEPSSEPPIAETAPPSAAETPVQNDTANASGQVSTSEVAKSMKCDICGRLFKSNLEVEFHAVKVGHDKFSESTEEKKPLSEEEKKEQLRILAEKLRQKNKEREEQEKRDEQQRERNRIKAGKELAIAKRRLQEIELKKIAEERLREREAERIARMQVRRQIEADKAARRAQGLPVPPLPAMNRHMPPCVRGCDLRDNTQTKLQIRLTNGQKLTQTFAIKEQLSAVRLFIEMNRTDGSEPFNLITTFPTRIFAEDDYDTPLDVLGLTPSAVVIVQNKKLR